MESTLSRARASSLKLAREKFVSATPQKKGLLITIIVLLILSIGLAIYSIFLNMKAKNVENVDFFNENEQWRKTCDRKCDAKYKIPPLLLISLDGFRADYIQRNITPSIRKLLNCGTSAPYMYPSYPSKTFPNHYTIVTGLYPESHGIVSNGMYDKEHPQCSKKGAKHPHCGLFKTSNDTSAAWWYDGEPIWNTVKNERKKSGTFFWPGSYFVINGKSPDYIADYDIKIPFSSRVDQVIKWLTLPDADRPSFMTMYFHSPDKEGHNFGPDSDEVNSAVIYVDAMLNYLMSKLDQKGLLGCINIVLVSDHGMQALYPNKKVKLFEEINLKGIQTFGDVVMSLVFNETEKANAIEKKEIQNLMCKKGEKFKIYSMDTMPRRNHYSRHRRIGDIFIEGNPGVFMYTSQEQYDASKRGNHGFDNREPTMRAIFSAYGPSFKKNHVIKPFQNIELYNMMSDAMGLSRPAPNNGTYGSLHNVFVDPPSYPPVLTKELPICNGLTLNSCGDSCHFEVKFFSPNIQQLLNTPVFNSQMILQLPLPNMEKCYPAHSVAFDTSEKLCQQVLCNATIVTDSSGKRPVVIESLLMDKISNLDHRANCSLKFGADNDTECPKMSFSGTISFFTEHNYLWFLEEARIQAPDYFIKGIWKEVQDLLYKYQRHYKTLRMFAGPIYDKDNNGVADEVKGTPTHVFIVLVRCSVGTEWKQDYAHCENPETTRVLSFILPLNDKNLNCLHPAEYLYTYSARVRDVELLTGLEFFTNREHYPDQIAIELRTFISESLWQLEQQTM